FPAEDVGVYVLPLMIFHIIQLLVCAVIAKHYARLAVEEEEQSAASTTEDENRAAPDAGGNSAVDSAESAHRRGGRTRRRTGGGADPSPGVWRRISSCSRCLAVAAIAPRNSVTMVRHPVCARSHAAARVSMSFGSVPAAANRA